MLQGLALGLALACSCACSALTVNANVQPFDALAFALVPIPLFVAAFFAGYIPARRTSRVDPNEVHISTFPDLPIPL